MRPLAALGTHAMPKKIKRLVEVIKEDGIRAAFIAVMTILLGEKDAVKKAKDKVLKHLVAINGYVIAYGPFKGMKLNGDVWWGKYSVNSKLLGVYEKNVLDKICAYSNAIDGPFVDIGAADGYYAIGVAYSGLNDCVYAYEIGEKGRDRLVQNAILNGCGDKVAVEEEANYERLSALIEKHGRALFLIDIEGAEYALLDRRTLTLLRRSCLIVELHPWKAEDGYNRERDLIARAEENFHVDYIGDAVLDPNQFGELHQFTDDERLLALSEGRDRHMRWMVLEPKAAA